MSNSVSHTRGARQTRTDLFAFICTYLRVFALKTSASIRSVIAHLPAREAGTGRVCYRKGGVGGRN